MTPPARVQAAIEILDLIIASARDNGPAADTIVASWFKTRRYAGSKDRRAVRDLVYLAIRTFGDPPENGRAAMVGLAREDDALAAAFDGSAYGPASIENEAAARTKPMPDWLGSLIDPAEHAALLARAPLDLRVNAAKTTRDAMLAHFAGSEPIDLLPNGIRIASPVPVENDTAYRDGLVEVQDAGSQLIAAACRIGADMTVIDLCAGGGGKTLALAADMQGTGRLIACDTDKRRLAGLAPRAARAGAAVETRLLDAGAEPEQLADLAGLADIVLVDAPCSGTGTLRRNPEARWRLTAERLERLLATQKHVLTLAAPLVRPGGALVYAVCSMIDAEGSGQAEAFLASNPYWIADDPLPTAGRRTGLGRTLTPAHDSTDGFFIARLIAPC